MKRLNPSDSHGPEAVTADRRPFHFGLGSLFLLVAMVGLFIASATNRSPAFGLFACLATTVALGRVRLFHVRNSLKLITIGGMFVCIGLLPFEFVGWLTPVFSHEGYGMIVLVGYIISLLGACVAACGMISLLVSLTDRLTIDEHQSDPRH